MLETINNYQKISNQLHTSAQPDVEEFGIIKQAGIEIVINLARADSPNAIINEAKIVHDNNMDYINIPVDFENPKSSDLELFFTAMERHNDMRILVHCACNWRVSCFIYLYRIIKLNCNSDIAKKDMLTIWQPNEVWQSFISNVMQNEES